jgi:hypothetical protein
MPVEPTNRIYETPKIKRDENVGLPQRRRPKQQQKKKQEKESGKVDIKI